jgi:VanZ family protein
LSLLDPALRLTARRWPTVTLVVLAAISYLSLAPLDQLPPAPGGDKLHHLAAYALLALPSALARPKAWPLLLCGFVAWGGVVELIQPFVNRYGEMLDFLANAAGVAIGAALGAWARRSLS